MHDVDGINLMAYKFVQDCLKTIVRYINIWRRKEKIRILFLANRCFTFFLNLGIRFSFFCKVLWDTFHNNNNNKKYCSDWILDYEHAHQIICACVCVCAMLYVMLCVWASLWNTRYIFTHTLYFQLYCCSSKSFFFFFSFSVWFFHFKFKRFHWMR